MKAINLFFLAVIMQTAFGCGTSRQFVNRSIQNNESSKIYVLRNSNYGKFISAEIFANNELIGDLKSKSYLEWSTDQKSISIESKIGKPTKLDLELEPGKTYFIRQGLNPFGGVLRSQSTLELLSEEEGRELLSRLKEPILATNK